MRQSFYDNEEYRKKQSDIMKRNWRKGIFNFERKQVAKVCSRRECINSFTTQPADPKKFCSQSCAARVNNTKRILSDDTKRKISRALSRAMTRSSYQSSLKGIIKVPRVKSICQNVLCRKGIIFERWQKRKFCSNKCAMAVIGGRPTSPRAARAKAGKREDLGDIYFYSRWEANFARFLSHFNIEWQYQPKTFDLKTQHYTPDFYLPEYGAFIEIKNFLSPYSLQRDQKFRQCYPHIPLVLILKKDYISLKNTFARSVKNWEYS